MGKVSLSSVGEAVRLVRSESGRFAAASFVVVLVYVGLFVLQEVTVSLIRTGEPLSETPTTFEGLAVHGLIALPFSIAFFALVSAFEVGLASMALDKIKGREASFTPAFSKFGQFLIFNAFVSTSWLSLELLGARFAPETHPWLSLLTGFALYIPLTFVPLLIVRGGHGWREASVLSVRALWRQIPITFFVMLVAFAASLLGVVACLVGLLFTWAIHPATVAVNYSRVIEGEGDAGSGV